MSDEKKEAKPNIINLVRKYATLGKSAQARRLMQNAGGIPKKFKKVVPKPNALKE